MTNYIELKKFMRSGVAESFGGFLFERLCLTRWVWNASPMLSLAYREALLFFKSKLREQDRVKKKNAEKYLKHIEWITLFTSKYKEKQIFFFFQIVLNKLCAVASTIKFKVLNSAKYTIFSLNKLTIHKQQKLN